MPIILPTIRSFAVTSHGVNSERAVATVSKMQGLASEPG